MNLDVLPQYEVPSDYTQETFLRFLIDEGIVAKKLEMKDEIRLQIERELDIIKKHNLINFYLIVWDIIHFANENGIFVGTRCCCNSGCLVDFLLGITKVNPLKFNLKFKYYLRYINVADILIDVEKGKENLIYNYLAKKYGKNSVCTYERYYSRYNANETEYIISNFNLVKTFENDTNYYLNSKGILCSKESLYSNELKVPTIRLCGMDYLRITNLKLLKLKENFNLNVDAAQIPLDDQRVFKKLREINFRHMPYNDKKDDKIFTEQIRKFKPNCFNDLVFFIAFYRRYAVSAKNIYENVLKNKNEKIYKSEYNGTEFENILKETYYELAYREQAAEILSILTQHKKENFCYPISSRERLPEISKIEENNNNIHCPKNLLEMLKNNNYYLFLKADAVGMALDIYFGTYLDVLLDSYVE